MNPFKYKLSEVRKLIVSAIFVVAAVVGLFTTIDDPTFVQACVALVGPVFAVIGVFGAKNKDSDDLQKALEQLKGAALTVVGYFTVVPPSTEAKLGTLIVAAASVFAIYWTTNQKPAGEGGAPAPADAVGAVAD